MLRRPGAGIAVYFYLKFIDMKLKISTVFYFVMLFGIVGAILLILNLGRSLEPAAIGTSGTAVAETPGASSFLQALSSPVVIVILQLIVIIFSSQLFVAVFRKIGQPAVIGEIIAGIVLGPSLLGMLMPELSAFLFPKSSLGNLQMLSQVGLVLFMFVIGMELNIEFLRKKAKAAVIISHASILVPYLLGVLLALFLYKSYAPANIPFYAFTLFLGIAMSITAFPVLARIIKERGIVHTRLGTIALTCAAADDITAWCLLAFVIAIVKAGSLGASIYTILLTVAFIVLMLYGVKPVLRRVIERRNAAGTITRASIALVFTVLLVSAFISELIGIHALFGAFLAGTIMPQSFNFREQVIGKTEDVTTVLLLPLFFVFTGLRTQIGLLNDAGAWGICLLITLVAVVGKFGGSALAARVTGENLYSSLAIGTLMNTRGLVELVVLNIGYDLGILTPKLFAMFVLMALITTVMTNPLMNKLNRLFPREAQAELRS